MEKYGPPKEMWPKFKLDFPEAQGWPAKLNIAEVARCTRHMVSGGVFGTFYMRYEKGPYIVFSPIHEHIHTFIHYEGGHGGRMRGHIRLKRVC